MTDELLVYKTPEMPFRGSARFAGWQPIATAPKDGTRFLAWEAGTQRSAIIWRRSAGWDTDAFYMDPVAFTHWMPLPPPPAQEGGE